MPPSDQFLSPKLVCLQVLVAWLRASKLYHIHHKCQLEVSTECLEPWDLKRVWLFRIVRLMKKQFLCLLPHMATGSCQPFCHFYQHHPCGDFNPVQWLASGRLHCRQHKVIFCWWITKMCHHVYIKLVLPNQYWHVTTCHDPNVTPFHFHCPDSEVAWHSLMVWCCSTTEVYFVFFLSDS